VRFIADMCMDVRVASWLNSQGHDATHLRDEGLQRLPNGGVFEKANAGLLHSLRRCWTNLTRREMIESYEVSLS
jgi:Domain of unknown function (DUF5615)